MPCQHDYYSMDQLGPAKQNQCQPLTLRMRRGIGEHLLSKKSMFVSQISEISTAISRINEPIPGMFGLF